MSVFLLKKFISLISNLKPLIFNLKSKLVYSHANHQPAYQKKAKKSQKKAKNTGFAFGFKYVKEKEKRAAKSALDPEAVEVAVARILADLEWERPRFIFLAQTTLSML